MERLRAGRCGRPWRWLWIAQRFNNVIFQKQGEVTASLLPEGLSGYAFLFPSDRDLDRARALRGGANPSLVMLGADDTGATMQLAAARLALNLQ